MPESPTTSESPVSDLTAANDKLARVEDVSSEALLLSGSTSVCIRLVSDMLATLTAQLDSEHAAA